MIRKFGGRISFWTTGTQRLYHYSAAEALGRTCQDLLKTVANTPLSHIEEEVRDCGAWEGELIQERRDGARIVVASQWSLLRDDRDEQAAVMVCNSDVKAELEIELLHEKIDQLRDKEVLALTEAVQSLAALLQKS